MKRSFSIRSFAWRRLTFWHFQMAGWTLMWCADMIIASLRNPTTMSFLTEAAETPLAFLTSLLLREVYKRFNYKNLSVSTLGILILFWSFAFTLFWYLLCALMWMSIFGPASVAGMLRPAYAVQMTFILAPIWIVWSLLYFSIKYWLEWETERGRARIAGELAQRAQLQMLRYQLNPHFLFNALNSVRALIDEDKRLAKGMITELSEFLRYSLINKEQPEVTLKDELEVIRHYLSIEKKRFEENLDVTFEIEPAAENYPVLSFLLHPLVENAIKYGMTTSPMPLRIGIGAQLRGNRLFVEVSNTGRWLQNASDRSSGASGTGTGLENVCARLENAFPDRYRLETRAANGEVTIALEIENPVYQGRTNEPAEDQNP